MRSMALCFAVWMIHARGESGTPSVRHRSTAAVKASWAASSAISKSRNCRIKVATIRPQSERYTPSTAALEFGSMADNKNLSPKCRFQNLAFDLPVEEQYEIHVIGLPRRAGPERGRA